MLGRGWRSKLNDINLPEGARVLAARQLDARSVTALTEPGLMVRQGAAGHEYAAENEQPGDNHGELGPQVLFVVYKETSVNPGFKRNLTYTSGSPPAAADVPMGLVLRQGDIDGALVFAEAGKLLGGIANAEAQGYPVDETEVGDDQCDIENILIRQALGAQWIKIAFSHCRGRRS